MAVFINIDTLKEIEVERKDGAWVVLEEQKVEKEIQRRDKVVTQMVSKVKEIGKLKDAELRLEYAPKDKNGIRLLGQYPVEKKGGKK
jgi:hypothetical protein